MLAPLLLGTGMLLRSVKSNASYVIPRLGLMVVLLWVIWFFNSVIQNTWAILRNQGRLDARMAAGLVTFTECITLLLAGIVMLSMLGINISGLLLPAGICVAIASQDLLQNLLAGFFLFIVQPFRIGDTVAVTTSLPSMQRPSLISELGGPGPAPGPGAGWFEGTCEKVDLRWAARRLRAFARPCTCVWEGGLRCDGR
jgi:small-conductance mechanosensitive channel